MKTFTHKIGEISYNIYIGQNSKENWDLIVKADTFDLWFHLDNESSGHVVVIQDISTGHELFYPNQIITLAGNYCKTYCKSKYKSTSKKVNIIYTEIGNIRKGKSIGSVEILNKKNTNMINL